MPLQAGVGQIGIRANPLQVGDRETYIDDSNPFSDQFVHSNIKTGFLYPEVLKGISYISINLFKKDTTSYIWNSFAILITTLLSICTLKFLYYSGKLFCDEKTGILSIAIFAACPYTYFYNLTGGLTTYVLFGTSACTYLILKLNNIKKNKFTLRTNFLIKLLLVISLIYMSSLRPSSVIFSICISIILIFLEIKNIKTSRVNKRIFYFSISLYFLTLVIGLHQLWETKQYSIMSIDLFQLEQGTFMGFDRDLIREQITILKSSNSFFDKVEGFIYQLLWKINDFLTGMIDIRDTHSPLDTPLLSFLARISIGTFFMAPLTYIFTMGFLVQRRYIFNSNLWICLIACLISISPSLIGVAMSRYYFMFITPFILIAAMTLTRSYDTSSTVKLKKYD